MIWVAGFLILLLICDIFKISPKKPESKKYTTNESTKNNSTSVEGIDKLSKTKEKRLSMDLIIREFNSFNSIDQQRDIVNIIPSKDAVDSKNEFRSAGVAANSSKIKKYALDDILIQARKNHADKACVELIEEWRSNNPIELPKKDDLLEREESFGSNSILFFLRENGIESFWHMTHKENIFNILNNGLVNNQYAYEKFSPKDISDPSVQRWRENIEPIYNRAIKKYVPLYINIRNPMLYRRKNIQHDLCLIEISLSVLNSKNFIFTDGNAASRETKFFKDKADLSNLPWDVLKANYWNDFFDGKRKRCAEFLVYPNIEAKYIKKIHCNNLSTLNYLRDAGCNSFLSNHLFFK